MKQPLLAIFFPSNDIHTYIHTYIHILYLNTIKFKSTDVLVGSCVIILKILNYIKCVLCRNASLAGSLAGKEVSVYVMFACLLRSTHFLRLPSHLNSLIVLKERNVFRLFSQMPQLLLTCDDRNLM